VTSLVEGIAKISEQLCRTVTATQRSLFVELEATFAGGLFFDFRISAPHSGQSSQLFAEADAGLSFLLKAATKLARRSAKANS
jgi:hypothetical protein